MPEKARQGGDQSSNSRAHVTGEKKYCAANHGAFCAVRKSTGLARSLLTSSLKTVENKFFLCRDWVDTIGNVIFLIGPLHVNMFTCILPSLSHLLHAYYV